MRGELPSGWDADIAAFPADAKGIATRIASGKVMAAIAPRLPGLVGGSADLDPSTHTALKGLGDFEPGARDGCDMQGSAGGGWSYAGRTVHFGVREHAMGAILNGLAAHGGVLPSAPLLVFGWHAPRCACRDDGPARDLRLHRQHRTGEDGNASAGGTAAAARCPAPRVIRPATPTRPGGRLAGPRPATT
jgi:transketolase